MHTLTISDHLYERLERTAQRNGYDSIEAYLAAWQGNGTACQQRVAHVERIDRIFSQMSVTYGEMPDSVVGLREDRER